MAAAYLEQLMRDEHRAMQSRRALPRAPFPDLSENGKLAVEVQATRAEIARLQPAIDAATLDVARAVAVSDKAEQAVADMLMRSETGDFISAANRTKLTNAVADAKEKLRIERVAHTAACELQEEPKNRLILLAQQRLHNIAADAFELAAIATERKQLAAERYEDALDQLEVRRATLYETIRTAAQADAVLARSA